MYTPLRPCRFTITDYLCLYHVQTTHGRIELYAFTEAQAISTALELAGPGARVLRVWREREWLRTTLTAHSLTGQSTSTAHCLTDQCHSHQSSGTSQESCGTLALL